MAISDAQVARIRKKVGKTLGVCPVCKTRNWHLHEELVAIPGYDVLTGGPTPMQVPAVLVGCSGCGMFRFFSAITLGLVPGDSR